VETEGKEVGDDRDLGRAGLDEEGGGSREVRLAELQERRFDTVARGEGEVGSDGADSVVGRLHAGAVSEDNDPPHCLQVSRQQGA